MNPFQPWRSAFALWALMAEAQAIVALRTLGMMGLLAASPRERHTMVAEKGPAFARSALAAGAAAIRGESPDRIAQAAIRPLKSRTSANLKRLTKPKQGP